MAERPPMLGEIIRRQRELNELSMRRFADMVGISNPYLSQIERGLREPSQQVLDAIAQSLEMSADTLYEKAGRGGEDGPAEVSAVVQAIERDPLLSARQRRTLIEVYEALTAEARSKRPRRRRKQA